MLPEALHKRRIELLSLLGLLAVVAGLAALFNGWHLDRSFVTYRTARNLADGAGFAYNPPGLTNAGGPALAEPVAPLYAAMLALGSRLIDDLPRLSNLIGSAAIGLSALAVYLLVHPAGRLPAALAGAVTAATPLLWLSLGLEAALWMAFGLLAVWLYVRAWTPAAAVLLALATLMRPEMAVLVVVLSLDAVLTGRRANPLSLGLYATVVAVGLLWLSQSLERGDLLPSLPGVSGAPLPADLFAPGVADGLAELARGLFALSPLWVFVPVLGLAGIMRLARGQGGTRGTLLLTAWGGLHTVALLILGAGVYAWQLAPPLIAVMALAALGVDWLAGLFKEASTRRAVSGVGALLLVGASAHSLITMTATGSGAWRALAPPLADPAYAQAGAWLSEHTSPGVTVGAAEIGVLGYASERPIIDVEGRLQPDVAAARARGDSAWWLGKYAPAYLVLSDKALGDIAGDEWFRATYREVGRTGETESVGIWQRVAETEPLVRHFAGQVTYPGGLVLNSVSTDFSLDPLEQGRLARVRLEWMLEEPPGAARRVSIRIESRDGAVAALDGRMLNLSRAPIGEPFSTFHTLRLAPNLQPGVYDLSVGVGPAQSDLTWETTARGKIPFPDSTWVGAVSGNQAEFGDISLLGYRLARTDENIEITLLWQAVEPPRADYRVLVQVRDARGTVLSHTETEPHGGAYPTSVWSAGERLPDTYTLEHISLPPGEYEVYAGLLDPEGTRLLTLDGRDAVLVGRLSVTE